ncbi:MAG: hypothetical protein E7231_15095 [Cellulosilyticum sp.]|nr:hypothetical protein [Cellulosilyticum sp.]
MDISGISSFLGMQQDLTTSSTTEKTGEDFRDILNQAVENGDDTELKEACDQLESYMLSMVFKQMKESMLQNDENSLIPEGDYTSTFEDTMINAMADEMVAGGGMGLSDQLYKQIKNTYAAQMQISSQNETAAASAITKISNKA